jgi:hypothetical protein
MSERTERSEGHEGMPSRPGMSERTERSEGHEGRPSRPGMSERTERSEGSDPAQGVVVPGQAEAAEIERRPGVLRTILGRDQDDEDLPLPDLPPLPEDPRWRIEHMPMVVAAGFALVLCAASAGLFLGGADAALGAAAGVFIVTVSYTMSTLAVAWADALRPALIMPIGLAAYVIKYLLIAFILFSVAANGWAGGRPMAWGIAVGVVLLTAVQVWWVSRLARRNLPAAGPGSS